MFRIEISRLGEVGVMEVDETECISKLSHIYSISYCLQRADCFFNMCLFWGFKLLLKHFVVPL
jgi:hypothetical protein